MAQTLWQKTKGHGECLSNMQDTVVCSVVKLCLGAQPPWAPYEREEGVICVHWILRHSPVHSVSHEAIPFSRLFGKDLNCTLAFPHTPENNTSLLCVFTLLFFLSFFFVSFSSCTLWLLVLTTQPGAGLCPFVHWWVYSGVVRVHHTVGCRRSLLNKRTCEYSSLVCCSTVSGLYFQVISQSRMAAEFPDIASVFRHKMADSEGGNVC